MINRVLHIIGRMDRAGAETMLMNLYREIDRTKYQFDFVYFTDDHCDYDDEIESLGGRIIRINSNNPIKRFFSLYKLIKEGQWRIVHSHTLFSSGLHLLAAKLAKTPQRLAHSHSTSDANSGSFTGRIYQKSMRWMFSKVPTDYIACGDAAANYLFPKRSDVVIIPNAIDIDKFINAQGANIRKELGVDDNKLIIIQVGRFMPVKNHSFSVQIAASLRDAGVDFLMLFVGTGPELETIKSLIKKHDLEKQVHLLGLRKDIPELMAASDIMLMPSLHEGFPVVLVESQAVGLPAVIANTISYEVDLDIGLVNFVDLNSSADEWAINIQNAVKNTIPIDADRIKTLENHGFSARAGAERLMKIYNEK